HRASRARYPPARVERRSRGRRRRAFTRAAQRRRAARRNLAPLASFLDVASARPLRRLDDVERDRLAFLQRVEIHGSQLGAMKEHLVPVICTDETKSTIGNDLLDAARSHGGPPGQVADNGHGHHVSGAPNTRVSGGVRYGRDGGTGDDVNPSAPLPHPSIAGPSLEAPRQPAYRSLILSGRFASYSTTSMSSGHGAGVWRPRSAAT